LKAIEVELRTYHDTWGQVEPLTIELSVDGWDGLVDIMVETMISLEQVHRPVLCRIAMAMATAGPILAPNLDIGLPEP